MQRGRILRDGTSGAGLISSNGQQYEFQIQGVWKSDVAPVINMVIEFELDSAGNVSQLKAVSESDLAREQAEKAMIAIKGKGTAVFTEMKNQIGMPVLIAIGVLIIGWFFMAAIKLKFGGGGNIGHTFWDLLGMSNSSEIMVQSLQTHSQYEKGLYGFLAIFAIAAPFINQFFKNPLLYLAYSIPLILMLLTGYMIYAGIQDSGVAITSQADAWLGRGPGGSLRDEMTAQLIEEMINAIKIAPGGIISLLASIYLSFAGLLKYLAAGAYSKVHI